MSRKPMIVGHRGNCGEAPMNTLAGIQEAIDLGADMVEVDVRLSADGVPVLMHNATVDETTDGNGPIIEMTLSRIKELDAGSWMSEIYAGERVPTLVEALALGKDAAGFTLDVKDERVLGPMLEAVADMNMRNQVIICGCGEDIAKMVRSIDGDFTVLLNLPPDIERLYVAGSSRDFNAAYIGVARRAGLPGLNVNHRYVSPELVRQAHLQSLSIWTYTVDDPERIRELVLMGVDAIYGNYPRRLVEIVREVVG
jgi:glycerophosphoryl diester phosphodiesterase